MKMLPNWKVFLFVNKFDNWTKWLKVLVMLMEYSMEGVLGESTAVLTQLPDGSR